MNSTQKNADEWDVIVVGGGPAGMMAASVAAENGARVLLLEKNETLGKKLLITGGGRCNVTNAEMDDRRLLEKFKENGKFLFSAFSQWSVKETLDFFHTHHMDTKVENELRVFPLSNSAQSVWDVLVDRLRKYNVTVQSHATVVGIIKDTTNVGAGNNQEDAVRGVQLANGTKLFARNVIIATGGMSRPETGSTGDGFAWLTALGHTVIQPTPSLVPLAISDEWVRKVAGVSMNGIKITILQNNEKQGVAKGKILFTHLGISGPTILNMSKDVGELLKYGEVTLSLDLLPDLDHGMLNTKLQEIFKINDKKKFRNSFGSLVPSALAPIIVTMSGIDPEIQCNRISREERLRLVDVLKHVTLHVDKLLGLDKAIIASGGVITNEIDFKTMRSRLYSNLYIIGDMLNIDRPSGGYSLQLCWTTGYVAGKDVSTKK